MRRGQLGIMLPMAFLAMAMAMAMAMATARGQAVPVRVEATPEGGYRLIRGGQPYFIKGGGGDGSRELLARCGGNSVRTWGADRLGEVLDEAQRHGLTVCAGIWLGHERHGFNYNDPEQVARQLEMVRQVVLKHKDHPALLLWGVGNEMEGDGTNAAIWSAVNNAAALVKKLDPNHPTLTAIAEFQSGEKLRNMHRLCPDVDIVGVNSYGPVMTLRDRYRKLGGTKPYVLTEFGPRGQWESEKTPWGAAPELTSTAKAERYRAAYESAVQGVPDCLGSYAFLWGQKQEATATWFGLLLPDGRKVNAVDALTELWSGKPPANRCPDVEPIRLDRFGTEPAKVAPGAELHATLAIREPDGDPVQVEWVLRREGSYGAGGDAEAKPEEFPRAIREAKVTPAGPGRLRAEATVAMPADGGPYRLFAYVRDDEDGAATANVPLHVDAPMKAARTPKATLPLVVYAEADGPAAYAPTGWMGNVKALALDPACGDDPHAGATCLEVSYKVGNDWAAVAWQSPPNDWGDRPGGHDLTGAHRLTFWARGAKGGEVVTFEFGILGPEKAFPDTARGKLERVTLTPEWTRYTLDLEGKDLSRIKTGFGFAVAAEGKPVTFYLDDVRYE